MIRPGCLQCRTADALSAFARQYHVTEMALAAMLRPRPAAAAGRPA
ncbi:MAG TPA: hypothetical protein VGI37_11915 [Streptosporangiaceae bacterium]|jgi:hypothetical protein